MPEPIDSWCAKRIDQCNAMCCTFDDGRCKYFDVETGWCGNYDRRPENCRRFYCTKCSFWLDDEYSVFNPAATEAFAVLMTMQSERGPEDIHWEVVWDELINPHDRG